MNTENGKTLIKDIEEDTNKWKIIPCSQLELILLKYSQYPKWLIDSVQFNPIKIPMTFLTEIEKQS